MHNFRTIFFYKAARITTKSLKRGEYTCIYRKENGLWQIGAPSMHYIIYIDKVWLMDFVTGTYLLLLVKQTYGLRCGPVRLILSSAVSASVFVLLLLLPGIGMVFKVLFQAVCVNLLLLEAAFSFRTKEMVVKSYVCMSGYALFMGGLVCCLGAYLPGGQRDMTCGKVIGVSTIAAGGAACYLYIRNKGRNSGKLYTVKLDFYGETLDCKGFADSGNSLYEPYKRRPVSILERKAAKELVERVPQDKRYLVPFHSVGKKSGLLNAVELPRMEVEEQGQRKVFPKVVVALSDEELTERGNYQVILHPDFVLDYN